MSPELSATKVLLHVYCGLSTFFSSIGGLEGHENTLLRDQATRNCAAQGSVRVYEPSLRTPLVLDFRYGFKHSFGISFTQQPQSIWTLLNNTLLISGTTSDEDSSFMAFYAV
jgi:hypothetical protein